VKHLYVINPPARPGYTTERHLSAGIGVSRKLKPGEKDYVIPPAPDVLLSAAVGEKCGLDTKIVDLVFEQLDAHDGMRRVCDMVHKEVGRDARCWFMVRLSIPTMQADLDFADTLKEKFPNSRVVLFGTVIMATIDHWVAQTKADALIYGEPEAVIGEMFLSEGADWLSVKGVINPKTYVPLTGDALYDGTQAKMHKDWVLTKDLSEVPFIPFHLIPLEKYAPNGDTSQIVAWVTASRGCPIGCTMCPYMMLEGRPLRVSAADRVVDELEYLQKNWGIWKIRFRDPNFGFNRKFVREICEKIIDRGIKIAATAEVSLEVVDDDLIALMAKAGITTITTGIESNDEECLDSIGQKIAINGKLQQKIELADSLGIHVFGTYVVGAPEESWDTVEKTIKFAKNLKCESAFTVMTPFPGTPLYFRSLQEGLLDKEMTYDKWNSYTATVRSRFLSPSDLDLARLWARLEVIIPYRHERAKKFGKKAQRDTFWHLLPRRIALFFVRLEVARRRKMGRPPIIEGEHRKIQKRSLAALGERS
jgi:magnesium-protoporphyrin IX monomethyl ester (oxidative) cyclase